MSTLINYASVACGGAIGCCCRYSISLLTARWFQHYNEVLATALSNMIGSFLIGIATGLIAQHMLPHPALRLLLITGCLGGLTTFSAMQYDSFILWQSSLPIMAMLQILIQVCLGFIFCCLGYYITTLFKFT